MDEYRTRSRSPRDSPRRSSRNESHDHSHSHTHSHSHRHHQHRSRSPRHRHRPHKHSTDNSLPLGAATLSKHDLPNYRPLFGLYLDMTKELDIDDLPEEEVKGRWKSFVKKWNNGDLREGWYDAKTLEKANRGISDPRTGQHDEGPTSTSHDGHAHDGRGQHEDDGGDDDDDFGPQLPATSMDMTRHSLNTRAGPSVPSTSDVRARNEQATEDAQADRSRHAQDLRAERKADRKLQDARLDELVPRADPGSRERQLEKKREAAASNRAFAAAKDTGGDVELGDADVMGDEDSLGELRRMKQVEERKRTEREVRREEMLRARQAEREERVKGMREKEAKTMEMLKSIAQARFGGGNG